MGTDNTPNGINSSSLAVVIGLVIIAATVFLGAVAVAIFGNLKDPTAVIVIALAAIAPTGASLQSTLASRAAAQKAAAAVAHVQTIEVKIDGRMDELIAAKDALVAQTAQAAHVAKELAEKAAQAQIEAARQTPVPPPTPTDEHTGS